MLVMTVQTPIVQRHRRWCLERASSHPIPLRVEQHLEAVCSLSECDRKHRHPRIRLVHLARRQRWIRRKPDGFLCRKLGPCGWVDKLHLHRFATKAECSRRAALVNRYGCVGMHTPLDISLHVDIVLEEDLLPAIDHTDTTLI